jgi:hypothetical protein
LSTCASSEAKAVVIDVAEIVVFLDSLRLNLPVEWLKRELRTLQGIDLATGQFLAALHRR